MKRWPCSTSQASGEEYLTGESQNLLQYFSGPSTQPSPYPALGMPPLPQWLHHLNQLLHLKDKAATGQCLRERPFISGHRAQRNNPPQWGFNGHHTSPKKPGPALSSPAHPTLLSPDSVLVKRSGGQAQWLICNPSTWEAADRERDHPG